MERSWIHPFTHYVFCGFNALLWILGCGSLGVGIWLYVTKTHYLSIAPTSYGAISAAGLCIAAGSTVLVVSFVGCCGACLNSRCLLITYCVFIIVIFIVETTAGVLGFLYRDEVKEVIRHELSHHLAASNPYAADSVTDQSGLRITWDVMQQDLHCCGVDGPADWFGSGSWPEQDWVPDSCCDPTKFVEDTSKALCGRMGEQSGLWFTKGCLDGFTDWLLSYMHVIGILGVLFPLIQVGGLICAIALCCATRDRVFFAALPTSDHESKHCTCTQHM